MVTTVNNTELYIWKLLREILKVIIYTQKNVCGGDGC